MTSKLVVNTIEADTGISSVSFASSISMSSTSKFHFSNAGIDIGADTNINRPEAGVLGFNINGGEKVRITSGGQLCLGTTSGPGEIGLYLGDGTNPAGHIYANGTHHLYILANAYFAGGWKYLGNGEANLLTLQNGEVIFNSASTNSSGAGQALTWSEKVRIDSSGRLLLGTTTEGQANADNFTIDGGDAETGITIRSGTSRGNHIYFSDGTSGDDEYRGIISYQHSDNRMQFFTNAVERLRINQHGGLRVFAAASDPTGIQAGEIYYNTTTNRLRVYNGSRWLNPDENKDPYASSVVCLFNGDSYTDLTGRHTLTQVGAGGLSNNYMSPVGSTSTYRIAHSNSTGNYMNITGNLGDFRLDDGNWTMEFWVRTTGTNGYSHYFVADGQNSKGTFKGYTNNSSVTEMAYFYSSNGTGVMYNPGGSPFAYNDWQHYAWDRTGSTTRFYLDGVVRASSTAAYPGGNPTFCHIGKWNNEAKEFYIDNFRFTRGVARYGGNGFEVPRTKYSSG